MKLSLFLFLLVMSVSWKAHAFKFSPMTAEIEPSTKKNSTIFFLENDTSQSIAVTAKVLKRRINIDGEEINDEVEKEFNLYPPQLIIPPNEKRSVKVTWNNISELKSEESFRLVAEQLPIDLTQDKKEKANIKVLLRYMAALYVTSDKFNSAVQLKSIETKNNQVRLLLENSGLKHQILANLNLKVLNGATETVFSGDELKGMSGENILANSQRAFVFPNKGKFKNILESSKIKLEFENN